VPCAGSCGTRWRSAMSKSCSPSAVWRRITRRSGVGCNDTVPNWNSDCGVILRPTNKSWRVDETYIRVQGRWCYLYRAIDSTGAIIDFLLSAFRDAAAAKRLFRQALSDPSHPQPRVINTDKARLYGSAIAAVKEEGTLRRVLWRRQRDENGQRVEHETRS
jgi:transposase-like protein